MTPCTRGCGEPTHRGRCKGEGSPHGGAAATFQEIADELGITREAAHQTFQRAIRKLRASGAGPLLGGLAHERELARKKPVSSIHAAREVVFGRREA